jgi:competence protein ComEA
VTDVTGVRDHPDRRGLVELRLDELFPDRSVRRGPGSVGDGWDNGGSDDGGLVAGRTEGVVETEAVTTSDVESGEFDAGYAEEPDPFATDDGSREGSGARVDDRAQRGIRSGRVAALTALADVGRWRIDPERRGAVAVMAAILVAALAVGWQAIASRPQAEPVSDAGVSASLVAGTKAAATAPATSSAAGPASTSGASTSASVATKVIVDVVGRVHRPGLVTLATGARVADAVRAAGGALAGTNLSSINLARVCVDGEQIAVGVTGATAPAGTNPTGAAPSSGAPAGLVNLNTATADQLDALPGVGPVMAQRIIDYRTDHGPFTAVTQLQQVSGIGDAKYADLGPLVTV